LRDWREGVSAGAWRQQLKTGGSKREAYGARLSWSATEILARRLSLGSS